MGVAHFLLFPWCATPCHPRVQDVAVVLVGRGETAPPGYALLDKPVSTRSFAVRTCLALRRAPPVGLCDLPFEPR